MLNVRQIESCREAAVLSDGQGLRLEVDRSLNRKWIFRFTLSGKRRDMGLGRFPDVTLRQARVLRDEARQLVAQGVDPIESRRLQRLEQQVTFAFAVERFIESKQSEWKNNKHGSNGVIRCKRMQFRSWVTSLLKISRCKIS